MAGDTDCVTVQTAKVHQVCIANVLGSFIYFTLVIMCHPPPPPIQWKNKKHTRNRHWLSTDFLLVSFIYQESVLTVSGLDNFQTFDHSHYVWKKRDELVYAYHHLLFLWSLSNSCIQCKKLINSKSFTMNILCEIDFLCLFTMQFVWGLSIKKKCDSWFAFSHLTCGSSVTSTCQTCSLLLPKVGCNNGSIWRSI